MASAEEIAERVKTIIVEQLGVGMDEVNPEPGRMIAAAVRNVIAKLVFLLVAVHWKRGDRSHKLVIAKSLKPRGGVKVGAEGECQGKTQMRVAYLHVMEIAGLQGKAPDPGRRELQLVVQQHAGIV